MTTPLPAGLTRFTGANTMSAQDASGALFLCFQDMQNYGRLVVIRNGLATEVPLGVILIGRPSLECNPLVGLWVVGSAEADRYHVPARVAVPGYVPFVLERGGVAPQVIAPDSPIAVLYGGTYQPSDLDTPAEIAQRLSKTNAAVHQVVAILEALGMVTRG